MKRLWILALLLIPVVLTACPSGGNPNNNDTTPPVIGNLNLQNAADNNVTAAKIIVLQATATDDKGLDRLEFFQGGTKIGEDSTAPYEQSVSITQANNGTLSFTAQAVDKAGNKSALSNAVSVTVDIQFVTLVRPSKSSAIAISGDDKLVVQVNPENDSISIFDAKTSQKLRELEVGDEPVAVVIHPDDDTAFVANRADATIMKITDLGGSPSVADTLEVGSEPTGIALSPKGEKLVVAEFAQSRVALIDTESMDIIDDIEVRNPRAVAITNDNDQDDDDEKVVVTEFYGRQNGTNKEAKDDSRTGAVHIFDLGTSSLTAADTVLFEPVAFTDFPPTALTSPNQLYSVAVAGDKFFVTATASSSDGAPAFNQNFFQLVLVGQISSGEKLGVINLSAAIKAQVPDDKQLFMADIVDVSLIGDDILYFASRGADGFQRAVLTSDNTVSLGFNDIKQVDLLTQQKCQNPIGIVTAHDVTDSKSAFVNCWVSRSMVTVDLGQQVAVASTASAEAPLGEELEVNKGRRFYFTGRARWSNEAWSSCGSCHPDGLSDNITWRFPSGPRQSTSMDSTFSHGSGSNSPGAQKQRILNWSGIFDEVHDFERNTRAVSGGLGAITTGTSCGGDLSGETRTSLNPAEPNGAAEDDPNGIKTNLGIPVKEIQDTTLNNCVKDWDEIEAFVKTIRPPTGRQFLSASSILDGRQVFEEGNCASCHGGAGWTVSRRFYEPSSTKNAELAALDFTSAGHTKMIQTEQTAAGPVAPAQVACVLRTVGTFGDPTDATLTGTLELKQPINGVIGIAQGQVSGYNVPGLYGLQTGAPYLHHGQVETLQDLFSDAKWNAHLKAGNALFSPSDANVEDLINFLFSIDATTEEFALPGGADLCPATF
jgi:DNA-binding beta-propeller fold protein YncE